ncbi:MAG: hypothetical protein JNM27_13450 [Leptospirales bacterium]|nr:hypothetical protein [Leptospirales bacterium]
MAVLCRIVSVLFIFSAVGLRGESPSTYLQAREPETAYSLSLPIPRDRPGFTYSTYEPTTFAQLSAFAPDKEKRHGLAIFGTRRRLVLTLPAHPTPGLTDDQRMSRDACGKIFPTLKTLPLHNHKLPIEIGGKKFLLLFQSQIVPYLEREAKPGQNVILFAFHATYDDVEKEHLLLVAEFYVPPESATTAQREEQQTQIATFAQLAKADATDLKSTAASPGSHLYREMLQLDLPERPDIEPLSEAGKMELEAFVKLVNLKEALAADCTHETMLTVEGQRFRLIWASRSAALYARNRNVPNTTHTVMAANGLLSDFTKIHTLVVFTYGYKTVFPENTGKWE